MVLVLVVVVVIAWVLVCESFFWCAVGWVLVVVLHGSTEKNFFF